MIKCQKCGGEMKPLGDGSFRCKYCRNVQTGAAASGGYSAPGGGGSTPPSYTPPPSPSRESGADVFEKNMNAVTEIYSYSGKSGASGSGMLIDRGCGYVITNAHVVYVGGKYSEDITVRIAGEDVSASIVALGDNSGGEGDGIDLAMLKLKSIPMKATTVVIGNFADVRIGETVYVVGNSRGSGTCITSGIVSDKSRTNSKGGRRLMTDCATNPGNSGGPLFNARGEVIGVMVESRLDSEGMNYAIPADDLLEFIDAAKRKLR